MYKYGQKGTQNGTKTATNNEQILALGSKKLDYSKTATNNISYRKREP